MPRASFQRFGVVLSPEDTEAEREGTINPACARTREGELLLLPRSVAAGNVSRVARCTSAWSGDSVEFRRDGFALEPDVPYEVRAEPGGYGCEDPRVTFVPALDLYLMAYCAFGPTGPRVAVATSIDARQWRRLGLINFGRDAGIGDKDAAFFPEIVSSPLGVPSYAILHRPTLHASIAVGRAIIPAILALPPREREGISIAYFPAYAVQKDIAQLLNPLEMGSLMYPDGPWGTIKIGTGPPPVLTPAGWLLMYHGIDPLPGYEDSDRPTLQYRAGVALLAKEAPQVVAYRSPEPVFWPEMPEELSGTVDDVVFPTGIDPRPEIGPHVHDIYYGMADFMIGRGRLEFVPD